MNMNTLIGAIKTAVSANSAVKTWTQATYGKDHTVFVGVDARNPPGEADCPLVAIFPGGKISGTSQDFLTDRVGVSCEITNEDSTTTGNATEYDGIQEIETFRQKVLDAIDEITDARITKIETEYEAMAFFPLFMCDMLITFEQETEFGDDFNE